MIFRCLFALEAKILLKITHGEIDERPVERDSPTVLQMREKSEAERGRGWDREREEAKAGNVQRRGSLRRRAAFW